MTWNLRLIALAAVLSACSPKTDETGDGSSSTSGTTSDPTDAVPTSGGPPVAELIPLTFNHDVDILFILDNSESMADEQRRLVGFASDLIDSLERQTVQANYRIGFTTTDVGNPRCVGTTPENGALQLRSCLGRVADGEFTTANGDFSAACTDLCALGDEDLVIRPTATELDADEKPRKWLEKIHGEDNLEGSVEMVDAFRCFAPQGVTGCGFESHLEAMFRGVASSFNSESKTNHGFIRASALLSLVFISDETDCSLDPAKQEIFVDNKVFWSSPDDPAPTSAACWAAGVACEGAGPEYTTCHSENHDVTGLAGVADADAVLYPVAKYVDFIRGVEADKRQFAADRQVVATLIAGVPSSYEIDYELPYADSPSADYMHSFGIGPGCFNGDPLAPTDAAVPPVREREFAEAFDPGVVRRNVYSICNNGTGEAPSHVASDIADALTPACFPACAADSDPGTELLEPDCQVFEVDAEAGTSAPIAACTFAEGDEFNFWALPDGASVCFAPLADVDDETLTTIDDMSRECRDQGWNLEFELVRAAPAPAGITYAATCELSTDPVQDCPAL